METILFRAWSRKYKKMFYGKDVELWGNPVSGRVRTMQNDYDVDAELMQFTSLNDCEEKPIYNGDILSYTIFDHNDNDTQFKGIVKWLGSGFIITQIPDSRCNGDFGIELFWVHSQDDEMEIIGNIHEDKHLITPETVNQQ